MEIVIIVAKSDDHVIGVDGELAWHMPADLAFFHRQIEGCFLLSGRRSYESSQGKALFKGRHFVVITRQEGYRAEGGEVAHSIEEGIAIAEKAGAERLCVLGGEEIYRIALPKADKLIVTEVHTIIGQGDAFFPEIDPDNWKEYQRENHESDAANPYPYSFVFYTRIRS